MTRIKYLHKNYGDGVKVLLDVNFTFEDRKTYAIIGSSGGGRSAFIRCLNVLEIPTSGDIFYNEVKINNSRTDLVRVREKIEVVSQNFNSFDHTKAIDSVTYTLHKVKRMNAKEARAKGLSPLEKIGLRHRVDAYPHQLSGDEKQRCAIARALAMESDVLLFDKPTSAPDPRVTDEVLKVLQDLSHTGITMIAATCEMGSAKKVADYVIYMDKGNIEERSKIAEFFEEPKTIRAKELLSKVMQKRRERR